MPGVFVIAEWNSNVEQFIRSQRSCYHAEIAVTDQSGRFRISQFSGNFNPLRMDRIRSVSVYVPGFRESAIAPSDKNVIFIEPRTEPKEQQFRESADNRLGQACNESEPAFLPARKAQVQELGALAARRQEFEIVDSLTFGIETLEMGEERAYQNRVRRLHERDKTRLPKGTP